ncbi:MAG: TIGR01777 family protein [Chlorobi bacterium CHB2]|nr:TIGR01777 family protein [Chlorobi bacterium CHB2]
MSLEICEYQTRINAPVQEVFNWHERPGALARLMPPWERTTILSNTGGIRDGARVVLRVRPWLVPLRWVIRHQEYQHGRQFLDVQESGPFATYQHLHLFTPDGGDSTILTDRLEYTLPLQMLGGAMGKGGVRRKFDRAFRYRHALTQQDLAEHHRHAHKPRLTVLISGPNGLLGTQLSAFLTTGGHKVLGLTRGRSSEAMIHWNPATGEIDAARLEGVDAVVHLAGEPIAALWTGSKRKSVMESRVKGTQLLASAIARLRAKPAVMISASAVGYYGDRGAELLDESKGPGDLFLSEIGKQWEAAADPARQAGIRVVHPRIGVVLTPAGGALGPMLIPFRLGLGGPIGKGEQFWSWITIDDTIGGIHHAMMNETIHGPMNLVAPNPATNREFCKTLAAVLRRPCIVAAPAAVLKTALGQMGKEVLLASQRVVPNVLLETGYTFRHPELREGLEFVLGKG